MRNLFVFVGLLMTLNATAFCDDNRYLFEATVEKDDGAVVRSGPGTQYYPTSHLQKGERVKVIRKDSDGWLMIAPPRGSFSWVSSAYFGWASSTYLEYVDGHGTTQVKANHVAVYTGSELHPESISRVQTYLSKGDTVKVIGTQRFKFDDGPREMFKIHPVKGECRWIHRDSIASREDINSTHQPDHQSTSREREHEHLEGEIVTARKTHEESLNVAFEDGVQRRPIARKRPRPRIDEEKLVTRTAHDESFDVAAGDQIVPPAEPRELVNAGKGRLSAIDHQFHEMIRRETLSWDLDSVERKYLQLEEDINLPSMNTTIGVRLDAVNRYRAYYRDYVDFMRLTSETKQRDAILTAQQSYYQPQPSPDPFSISGAMSPVPISQLQTASYSPGNNPSFDGAGIVRRLPESTLSGPQFVLVAPSGRTLAYLQPTTGIDLNRYEGRAMGITGHRYYRSEWKAEAIAVRDLQPVQLHSNR